MWLQLLEEHKEKEMWAKNQGHEFKFHYEYPDCITSLCLSYSVCRMGLTLLYVLSSPLSSKFIAVAQTSLWSFRPTNTVVF